MMARNRSLFIRKGGESTSAELIVSTNSQEITNADDSLGSARFEERWIKDSAGKLLE